MFLVLAATINCIHAPTKICASAASAIWAELSLLALQNAYDSGFSYPV